MRLTKIFFEFHHKIGVRTNLRDINIQSSKASTVGIRIPDSIELATFSVRLSCSSMILAFLLLSPPAKRLSCDVTMRAVHFGDKREVYLQDESALHVTEKESMRKG